MDQASERPPVAYVVDDSGHSCKPNVVQDRARSTDASLKQISDASAAASVRNHHRVTGGDCWTTLRRKRFVGQLSCAAEGTRFVAEEERPTSAQCRRGRPPWWIPVPSPSSTREMDPPIDGWIDWDPAATTEDWDLVGLDWN
jgi:hypothetical protein